MDRLIKQHAYDPASVFCREQLQRTDLTPVLTGQLNVRAGFCCYKAKDFSRAADFFAQARECDDIRAAAAEFLDWSYQQCNDPAIRQKITAIRTMHGPVAAETA